MLAKIKNTPVNIGSSKIYNCLQGQFKRNTSNCRFASSLTSYANNVLKAPITLEYQREIEERAYKEFVMPTGGLTMKGGMERITKLTGTRYEQFKRGSAKFYNYLKKGYVIIIAINASLTFQSQRFGPGIIKGGKGTDLGHITCMRGENINMINAFRYENGKFYIVNSRPGAVEKEVESLDIYNVFKKWEDCGIILPL